MMTMDRPLATNEHAVAAPRPSQMDGIGHARYMYGLITARALAVAAAEGAFVVDLAASWDGRLAGLVGSHEPMSPDDLAVLDRLTSAALHPKLSGAALVEWVDAFPSGVMRLFEWATVVDDSDVGPWPAEVEATDDEVAANKQSTLALAA